MQVSWQWAKWLHRCSGLEAWNCRHLTLPGGFPDSGFQTDFPSGGFQTGRDPFFDSKYSTGLNTASLSLDPCILCHLSGIPQSTPAFPGMAGTPQVGFLLNLIGCHFAKLQAGVGCVEGAPRIGTTNLFPLVLPLLYPGWLSMLSNSM